MQLPVDVVLRMSGKKERFEGKFLYADRADGSRWVTRADGSNTPAVYKFQFGENMYHSAAAAEAGLTKHRRGKGKGGWFCIYAGGRSLEDIRTKEGFKNPARAEKPSPTKPRKRARCASDSEDRKDERQCTIVVKQGCRRIFSLADVGEAVLAIDTYDGAEIPDAVRHFYAQQVDERLRRLADSKRRLALKHNGAEVSVGKARPFT